MAFFSTVSCWKRSGLHAFNYENRRRTKVMTAVIIAPGRSPGMEPLNERYPTPLLPLVDRPFIQHVVEFLVEGGITQFEFVLSHLPGKIRDLLGDGSRWGSTFRFHLSRDPEHPYNILKSITLGDDTGPLLLVHADRLPQIDLKQTRPALQLTEPIMFFSNRGQGSGDLTGEDSNKGQWTGWAWLPTQSMETLPKDLTEDTLQSHLFDLAHNQEPTVQVPESLNIQSYQGLLEAQRSVLNKQFKGLFLSAREADESIWLSRNVSLHPTATLKPPVYINENCRIGKGITLGPHVVIGKDCVLDSGCTVTESVVFPGSYVGEGLELTDVIADKNCLINVRFGAAVSISESFILGGTSGPGMGRWLSRIFSQGIAVLLLLVSWPVILATALVLRIGRRGPVVFKKEAVRLPTQTDETQWQTFRFLSFAQDDGGIHKEVGSALKHLFLQFLPGLISIAKGKLCFIGVDPRTKEEVKALSQDWRALYLGSKPGVVSEAYVNYGDAPTEDELYAAEVFYSVSSGVGHDFKLLFGYLSRVLKAFVPSRKA